MTHWYWCHTEPSSPCLDVKHVAVVLSDFTVSGAFVDRRPDPASIEYARTDIAPMVIVERPDVVVDLTSGEKT